MDIENLNIKEGWGLTNSVNPATGLVSLFVTDSTNVIKEIDPYNWSIIREISVVDEYLEPLNKLNELEIINTNEMTSNYIFANRF